MKPHKWAKEIKAWADGAEIECKYVGNQYTHAYWGPWDDGPIDWNDEDYIFRVVEKPKEPQYLYAYKVNAKIVELYDEIQLGRDEKMLLGKIKIED
jgi:hypothetical protein